MEQTEQTEKAPSRNATYLPSKAQMDEIAAKKIIAAEQRRAAGQTEPKKTTKKTAKKTTTTKTGKKRGRPKKEVSELTKRKRKAKEITEPHIYRPQEDVAGLTAAAPNFNNVLVDPNSLMPIQQMSLQELADHINALDSKHITSKHISMVFAVRRIAQGVDIRNVEDMRQRFYKYIALCEATSMKIGNLNAYAAMGVPARTAQRWKAGAEGSTQERRDLLAEVDMICGGFREEQMQDGTIHPIVGIFHQKNFDGLRDVQITQLGLDDPLGEKQTPEQINEKYGFVTED
jgi:hypothetical protein